MTEFLIKTKEQKREKIQPSVEKGIRKMEQSETLKKIHKFYDNALKALDKTSITLVFILEKAQKEISSRLDDFLSYREVCLSRIQE